MTKGEIFCTKPFPKIMEREEESKTLKANSNLMLIIPHFKGIYNSPK